MFLRIVSFSILVVILLQGICFAESDEIEINDLKAPVSPALVLLGIESSAIERPINPVSLSLNFSSDITEIYLPKNYAIEFSPYILFKTQLESLDDYFDEKFFKTLYHNLSISIATTLLESPTELNGENSNLGTRIGFGIRTLLLDGGENKPIQDSIDLRQLIDKLEELTGEEKKRFKKLKEDYQQYFLISEEYSKKCDDLLDVTEDIELLEAIIECRKYFDRKNKLEEIESAKSEGYVIQLEQLEKELEALENEITEKEEDQEIKEKEKEKIEEEIGSLDKLAEEYFNESKFIKEIEEINKKRTGFILEIAGGTVWDIPGDKTSEAEFNTFGLWITPAYQNESPPIDIVSAIRFIREKNEDDYDDIFDFGTRLFYEMNKFTVSAEFVQRFIRVSDDNVNLQRYCLNIEYPLNDSIILSACFGKDFAKDDNGNSDLIAQISLDFGFGQPKVDLSKINLSSE